jgi:hypothetical protein
MGDIRHAVRRSPLLVTCGINMREHMIYGCDEFIWLRIVTSSVTLLTW